MFLSAMRIVRSAAERGFNYLPQRPRSILDIISIGNSFEANIIERDHDVTCRPVPKLSLKSHLRGAGRSNDF